MTLKLKSSNHKDKNIKKTDSAICAESVYNYLCNYAILIFFIFFSKFII